MLLKTKGIPHRISEPLVGRVTRNPEIVEDNFFFISENGIPDGYADRFIAILTNGKEIISNQPSVREVPTFDHLIEGDIVVVNPSGVINTLYRVNSHQNFLLA